MRPILRSDSEGRLPGLLAGILLCFGLTVLLAGCASSHRQRDYARLYCVVPGEEREDFGRLSSWIAERDGHITLPVRGTIHWGETAYYRWYSNETFVIVTCPPKFHEKRSEIRWLCGSISLPAKATSAMGSAFYGDYGRRGPGTYDFDGVQMRPWLSPRDGIFGVHFNDRRTELLRIFEWHISDQLEVNQRGARALTSHSEDDRFPIGYLRGYPGAQLSIFLSAERRVGLLKVRMPDSPGLAGLDFMKADPPVLRQGSFTVDASLAAKGLRKSRSHTKPHADISGYP